VAAVRRAAPVALLAAALVLGACGGGTDEAGRPASTGSDEPSADLLDFVAPDVRGGEVVGADLAGQDLVIWFWAPW